MKKIFKLLTALSAAAMTLSISTIAFPVNASTEFEISEIDGFDLYHRCEHKYFNANKEPQYYYTNDYYKFTNEFGGEKYEFHEDYSCVIVTVNDDIDLDELTAIANKPILDIYAVGRYHHLEDNQYAYEYSGDIDCESMYNIKGVEKVEKGKIIKINHFYRSIRFYLDDEWAIENNYVDEYNSAPDYPRNLMMAEVKTEKDMDLTVEMFSDTGFKVENVYEIEPDLWHVYFNYDGIKSYFDFDLNAEKINGVISSDVLISIDDNNGDGDMMLDTVIPFNSSEYVKGDISGNGKIDLYDAIEIAKYLVNNREFTDEESKIADFNGDNKVDLYDAIDIAESIL